MKHHIPTLDIKHTGNEEKFWGGYNFMPVPQYNSQAVTKHTTFPFNPQGFPAAKMLFSFPVYTTPAHPTVIHNTCTSYRDTQHLHILP